MPQPPGTASVSATQQRVRAVKLASELDVGIVQLQGLLHDLRIAAPNGASWIEPKDAARVLGRFDDERRRMAAERATLARRETLRRSTAFTICMHHGANRAICLCPSSRALAAGAMSDHRRRN
jgi:poly-gamma-glutamate capsule biosynthesis protein CapA/YwtB (metallophosphatase superfamily)